jgi:hypothetical protein
MAGAELDAEILERDVLGVVATLVVGAVVEVLVVGTVVEAL